MTSKPKPKPKQLQIICPGDWVMITRKRLKYAQGFTKGDVAQVKTINHEKGLLKINHPDYSDQVFLVDEITLTLPPKLPDLGCNSTAETVEICSLSPTLVPPDLGCNSTAETVEICSLSPKLVPLDLGCSPTAETVETCSLSPNPDPPDLGSNLTAETPQTCSLSPNLNPLDLGCNSTAEMPETCSLNFKQVIQWADTLSLPELNHLIDALQALQEVKENSDRSQSVNESDQSSVTSGYVELKRINGCGPYRYLRYRSGGRNRSLYLGKDHG